MEAKMLKSIKYEFIDELEYDHNGDKAVAEYIEIKAPNNKIKAFTTTLECAYKNASIKASALLTTLPEEFIRRIENNADKDEEQTSIEVVDSMLAQLDSKVMTGVYNALDMILKESAKLDGHTNFGNALFEKMSIQDTKYILGEYIKSFFIASPQALKSRE
jgi:hypothetical protein